MKSMEISLGAADSTDKHRRHPYRLWTTFLWAAGLFWVILFLPKQGRNEMEPSAAVSGQENFQNSILDTDIIDESFDVIQEPSGSVMSQRPSDSALEDVRQRPEDLLSRTPGTSNVTVSPTAVLHLGPPMAATKFIPEILSQMPKLLGRDEWVYQGTKESAYESSHGLFLHECQLNAHLYHANYDSSLNCLKLSNEWEKWVEEWSDFHQQSRSVIFSDAHITPLEGPLLREALDRLTASYAGHRRVTITYQPYMDWLLSEYYEQHAGDPHKPAHLHRVQGLVDWFREFRDSLIPITARQLNEYQEIFDSVYIFNIDELEYPEAGLIASWLCQVLPEASHTCASAKMDDLPPSAQTVVEEVPEHVHLPSIRLAQLHVANGALPDLKSSRQTVADTADIIRGWLQNLEEGAPLQCLNDEEVQEIWQRTVDLRDWMAPNSRVSKDRLRQRFLDLVDQQKFCQVDYYKAIKMPSWKRLWKS